MMSLGPCSMYCLYVEVDQLPSFSIVSPATPARSADVAPPFRKLIPFHSLAGIFGKACVALVLSTLIGMCREIGLPEDIARGVRLVFCWRCALKSLFR